VATRTEDNSMKPASATRAGVQMSFERVAHNMSNGATIKMPVISPSHHVDQTIIKSDCGANPLQMRLVTPTVALMAVPIKPPRNANLRTSCPQENALEPLA